MALNSWSPCLCIPVLGSSEYTTTCGLVLFSTFHRWMETVVGMKVFIYALLKSFLAQRYWQDDSTQLAACPAVHYSVSTQHRTGHRSREQLVRPWLWQENGTRSELQSTRHYCHPSSGAETGKPTYPGSWETFEFQTHGCRSFKRVLKMQTGREVQFLSHWFQR